MKPLTGSQARWSLGLGLVLAAGVAAAGCGPKQKFCPDTMDGVCPVIVDAAPTPDTMDAADEDADSGAIFIGTDAPTTVPTGDAAPADADAGN
jgi:hypothetical protein